MADHFIEFDGRGRPLEFVPPKISKRKIAKLAAALDTADIECEREDDLDERGFYNGCACDACWNAIEAIRNRRHDAALEYSDAVGARSLIARIKKENSQRVSTASEGHKIKYAASKAAVHLHELCEAGPDFYTTREMIDARANAHLTDALFEIAQEKFQDAERQERADKAAGIVRTGYEPTRSL
jgi:hypothetical protein